MGEKVIMDQGVFEIFKYFIFATGFLGLVLLILQGLIGARKIKIKLIWHTKHLWILILCVVTIHIFIAIFALLG